MRWPGQELEPHSGHYMSWEGKFRLFQLVQKHSQERESSPNLPQNRSRHRRLDERHVQDTTITEKEKVRLLQNVVNHPISPKCRCHVLLSEGLESGHYNGWEGIGQVISACEYRFPKTWLITIHCHSLWGEWLHSKYSNNREGVGQVASTCKYKFQTTWFITAIFVRLPST